MLNSKLRGRGLALGLLAAVACTGAGMGAGGSSASPTHPATEAKLMGLEREWSAAVLRHDPAAVARILADDYVGVDGRAVLSDKASEIKDAEPSATENPPPGSEILLDDQLTDMKVRVYGDTAIVNGISRERVRFGANEPKEVQFRRTTVWVKGGPAGWRCVSFHASRILR